MCHSTDLHTVCCTDFTIKLLKQFDNRRKVTALGTRDDLSKQDRQNSGVFWLFFFFFAWFLFVFFLFGWIFFHLVRSPVHSASRTMGKRDYSQLLLKLVQKETEDGNFCVRDWWCVQRAKAGKIKTPNGPGNSEAGLENKLKRHL